MQTNQPHSAGPMHAPPAGPPRHKPADRENLKSILSTVAILLVAPLIAVLLTAFVFQSYQVDGPSMEKTLYNNDRLIVWKMPRTWAKITGKDYIPNRGDVIVFTSPGLSNFGQDPEKQLIKRVIGLPGDRVVVRDSSVTVYNEAHPNGYHPDTDLPYQHTANDTPGEIDVTLKNGQLFVLGDNRQNSLDSPDFGPINAKDIVGKLIVRVLPVNEMTRF